MPVKSLLTSNEKNLLNRAVEAELYASNFYRHLANQCQRLGFFGAQKFFQAEAGHEIDHYQRLASFLNDRGDVATVPTIEAPEDEISGLRDAIEAAYDTELQLERDYSDWYRRCDSEVTRQFLLQFLEIQRQAVGEFGDLIARLDRAGDDPCGLLLIDKELGE